MSQLFSGKDKVETIFTFTHQTPMCRVLMVALISVTRVILRAINGFDMFVEY